MSHRYEVVFNRDVTGTETIRANVVAETAEELEDKIRLQDWDRCLVTDKSYKYTYGDLESVLEIE